MPPKSTHILAKMPLVVCSQAMEYRKNSGPNNSRDGLTRIREAVEKRSLDALERFDSLLFRMRNSPEQCEYETRGCTTPVSIHHEEYVLSDDTETNKAKLTLRRSLGTSSMGKSFDTLSLCFLPQGPYRNQIPPTEQMSCATGEGRELDELYDQLTTARKQQEEFMTQLTLACERGKGVEDD